MGVVQCATCGFKVNAKVGVCPNCGGDPRVAGTAPPSPADLYEVVLEPFDPAEEDETAEATAGKRARRAKAATEPPVSQKAAEETPLTVVGAPAGKAQDDDATVGSRRAESEGHKRTERTSGRGSRGISLAGLRIEPLQVRVDRNRIRYVIFLAAFLTGSAALLTLAFVAVPGALIGLVVEEPDYYSLLGVAVAAAFALLLVVGSIAAYSQVANAEHWMRSRFPSADIDADTYVSLHRAVEEISLAAGLREAPRLLLMGVPTVNACAIGAGGRRPIIGVTRGFLDALTSGEQQAVIATLIARITRGDILVATALAALMGPLKLLRDITTVPRGVADLADAGCGSGCGGCGDVGGCGDLEGCGDLDDGCAGALLVILFVIVVAAITWVAITVAAWVVTIWGRALHRTGHEKADAEGMLLLRHPQPMLSALRKAISSSNEIADGDPSYDGIFYASTSGKPAIDKVERRRYDRLREVLATDGLAASLPEPGLEDAGEAAGAEQAGGGRRLIDRLGKKSLLSVVPANTFKVGFEAARTGAARTVDWDAGGLRSRVGAEGHETKLWLEGGDLRWSCTCGGAAAAPCEHVVASAVATWPRRHTKKRK